jgi:predicted DNA-binding transcriptional regulator AlpA
MKKQTNDNQSTDVVENALVRAQSSESGNHSIEETRRVSSRDAAELLGVSESTLRKWRMRGYGPRFIKMGSRVVYETGELENWLEKQTRTTTMSSYRPPSRFEKRECSSTSPEHSAYGAGGLND